jgi:hypothetical protein
MVRICINQSIFLILVASTPSGARAAPIRLVGGDQCPSVISMMGIGQGQELN